MSKLIIVSYDNEYKAEDMRLKFLRMQKEYVVSIEDAVVVVKNREGKVKLHQMINLPVLGASGGGFWGLLIGVLFLHPLLGLAVGAAAGAVSGALSDVGIDDAFMKNLAAAFTPGSSALCILVSNPTMDKMLDELRGSGGTVLQTSLSHEDEARLQTALDGSKVNPDQGQPS